MDLLESVAELPFDTGLDTERLGHLFPNMTFMTVLMASLARRNNWFAKTTTRIKRQYDYLIVGGGTAGSVMANRLSENPCITVLLLEAGSNPFILTEVPALGRFWYGTSIDWMYKSTPQKHAAHGQIDNRVNLNSGKALGGSSVLNSMLYVRGNRKNYEDWASEAATGWNYTEVLPIFKKLEDNRNIDDLDKGFHAVNGPMTMERPNYEPDIKKPLIKAMEGLGYELTDINGRRQTGISDFQGTLRYGERCSTVKGYLVPAENRTNLDILKNAFVRKVLIRNRRAYGVEFEFEGRRRAVYAKREVIISSGTLRTPQLLMLSGIGPKDELKKFNISVVKDLPVGKNLQDHYAAQMNFEINSTLPLELKFINPINLVEYLTNRSGLYAAPTQLTVLGFLSGFNATKEEDFPKQELYFAEYTTLDALKNYNLQPKVYAQVFAPYQLEPLYTCFASLLQPKSRGEITLNSTDPHDYPLINPNYYEDDSDLEDIVTGLKLCKAIGTSEPMKKLGSKPFSTLFPGCEDLAGDDDKYYACQAKTIVTTFWHFVGTARMGDRNDSRSVVDPQLRVIGIRGLRVVSAAVMPIIPSANTNVPTMMVAEKAYEMMKKDIKCR